MLGNFSCVCWPFEYLFQEEYLLSLFAYFVIIFKIIEL